jgi:hypothetical protein
MAIFSRLMRRNWSFEQFATSVPSIMIDPEVGWISPLSMRTSVHDDEDFPFADIEARVLHAHRGAGRFEDLFLGLALPEHLAGGVGSFTEYLIDVPCG